MKVYIGKYPHWWNTHNFEKWLLEKCHKKPYWQVEDEEYTSFDHAVEWACDKWQVVLNATVNKLFQKRKIKVRIDEYDVWSMDHTLAHIIHPMLIKLKEQKHGNPWTDDEDVPEHLRSTAAPPLTEDQKMTGSTDDNFEKRWDWIMDEMIWSFGTFIDDEWDDQFYTGKADWQWKKIEEGDNKGLSQMIEGPNHTYMIDTEGLKAAEDRRMNGLRLFAKYYRALWD